MSTKSDGTTNKSFSPNTPKSDMSVPLLRSTSHPEPIVVRSQSAREKRPDSNKHQFSVDHAQNIETGGDKFVYPPLLNYLENKRLSLGTTRVPANGSNRKFSASQPHRDIAAMSVLSLLDNKQDLDTQMDTDKDLDYIEVPIKKVSIDIDAYSEPSTKEMTSEANSEKFCNCNCNKSSQEDGDKNSAITLRKQSMFSCPKPTIYFNDKKRSVDFILVWDSLSPEAVSDEAKKRRKTFENELIKEGLELEYEPVEPNGLQFLKIHAPDEVLRRYGEILKLRMPMKEELCKPPKGSRQSRLYAILSKKILGRQKDVQQTNFLMSGFSSRWERIKKTIFIDTDKFPEKGHRFTAIYSRDREYLFDVNSSCFFTPAIHSRIVQFILDRKRFSDNHEDDFAFGIERLLNDKTYIAAYPLHDGDLRQPGSMRKLLYEEWAGINKWYRYQPLDYVKEYFGVKIALYFAWLGFYTHMLMSASLVGLMCFLYSCFTMFRHKPSQEICEGSFNVTMCPQCDHKCDYWFLNKGACFQFRITYLSDNATTVFFAVFMSIWATIFLELWKRYSAEITHRWDLTGFDVQEEHPRPQYLARLSHVKRKQMNIITNTMEPHVPFWRMRVPATVFSFSVVILLVALAFATVVGVILYRMSVMTALRVQGISGGNTDYITLFTTVTAACINLCCIIFFNWIYSYLAEYLTEMEFIRTQSQFDDSLTLKIYLLQFVNYYASIFYIAFFKGKFIGYPKRYNTFFGHRQEECSPGGCLMELCIQLAIIMIGKQAMNTVLEMMFPLFFRWMNTLKVKTGLRKDQASTKEKAQWIKDFKLVQWGPRSLFPEYLEMVLQYGFVTIFVAAFPLAPLFALLNNVLEMRLDARKLLMFYRRPVTQRVRDIGVWYRILDSIGKLSVITNGFIIAFTSNFITRIVYRLHVSGNYSLDGYLNHSLSVFKTSDFDKRLEINRNDVEFCRYADYREAPESPKEYELSSIFWHILAARLAFVVVFENVVASVIILVKWLIPDVPGSLRDQIRRENYITNEIIIKQEALRAKTAPTPEPASSPPMLRRLTLGVGACPTTSEDWDHIIDRSLSESDFDLMMHSHTYPPDNQHDEENAELKTPTSV